MKREGYRNEKERKQKTIRKKGDEMDEGSDLILHALAQYNLGDFELLLLLLLQFVSGRH